VPVNDKFQIDEVQACILVRTFIYSHGLSGTAGGSLEAIAAGLAENITPLYGAERLHTFRVLIPLFYVMDDSDHRLHEFGLDA
jgi:nuclear pore complex protein Nup188